MKMGKLFCLSVFGRKGKTSRALALKDTDLKDTGCDKSKTVAVSKLPMFVKDPPAMQRDTVISSPGCAEAALLKGVTGCEGVSLSRELPPCKSHACGNQEAFASTSQSSFMSVERYAEEALFNTEEELIQESGVVVQPDATVESALLGVCANQSESVVLDWEFMKQVFENSSKHSGEEVGFSVVNAEAAGQGISGKTFTEDMYKSMEEASQDAIFHYRPDKAILSLKSNELAWDDDLLGGHISNRGVYQGGEEIQSRNEFSVMQAVGSVMHSSAMEGSTNPDSLSRVSVAAVENVSEETCCHCSDPTYHVTEVVCPRPHCLSIACISGTTPPRIDWSADTSAVCAENWYPQQINTSSDMAKSVSRMVMNDQKLKGKANYCKEAGIGILTVALGPRSLVIDAPSAESSLNRVKEWISTIEQPDMAAYEAVGILSSGINEEFGDGCSKLSDTVTVDQELARAVTRSLSAYSTVAHMACIGLQEVPSLGVFNCLKTLNLSVNCITRIHAGYLPQSLHALDLSRNRISQIEGFRELTRLRVLNLSYNRISRIGHGLANCTLIKELYLVGNKIADVDGLHRLLKLTVLDLSHNKIVTSKALGQLAANYNSLLALNLLGNPISMNTGEDQLRKLITSLIPHVTYLNKEPIKAISVREAVVDNVAKAALGTSQRNIKPSSSRVSRKVGVQSAQRKLPSYRYKDVEKLTGSSFGRSSRHRHHQHSHHPRDSSKIQQNDNNFGKDSSLTDLFQCLTLDSSQGMHRSRSDGALCDE